MKYGVSIDWLALHVKFETGDFERVALPNGAFAGTLDWGYRRAEHGTKQFHTLWHVSHAGEPFAEVQCDPCSGILEAGTGIIKFDNRLLYLSKLWYMVDMFLTEHHITVLSISRIDLCGDFNAFKHYDCIQFVSDFMTEKLRHKGRGVGAAYFDHYTTRVGKGSKAVLKYTGIGFGSRQSGVRVYLYNKTFELNTVKNKPYIRDFWRNAGLDTTKDVWRLEVSITAGAKKFKCKQTGQKVVIDTIGIRDGRELVKLYHTFVHKYFSFIKNRAGITNITREPIIELFEGFPFYQHGVIRNTSTSNRTERILIKQLWQMADRYRGLGLTSEEDITKTMAEDLAHNCDLREWFVNKVPTWEKPLKK